MKSWESERCIFSFTLFCSLCFFLIRNSSSFYLFVYNSQIYFLDEFRISQFMCWMKSLRWVRCLWWDFRWRLNCESHSGLDLFSFFAIVSKQKRPEPHMDEEGGHLNTPSYEELGYSRSERIKSESSGNAPLKTKNRLRYHIHPKYHILCSRPILEPSDHTSSALSFQ